MALLFRFLSNLRSRESEEDDNVACLSQLVRGQDYLSLLPAARHP